MEELIRLAAFNWLKDQTTVYGDVLPWDLVQKGFVFNDERITLIGQSGIWKPRVFEKVPISITTTYNGPYEDESFDDGSFTYKYRGTDPFHRDNIGLREAMKNRIPLIYFVALLPGKYKAIWPVYITNDNPATLSFSVQADDSSSIISSLQNSPVEAVSDDYENARRSYITSSVKSRLHQSSFRERVLRAYREQCAFCKLKHTELLDAAHIISDGDEMGEPLIVNGLSLCKIHHAAFDSNIVGVRPDYKITVREDILIETDGPMLKHGIQELQDKNIILPTSKNSWPDVERLTIRYEKFREAR
jgi:putative restriction endonuclease